MCLSHIHTHLNTLTHRHFKRTRFFALNRSDIKWHHQISRINTTPVTIWWKRRTSVIAPKYYVSRTQIISYVCHMSGDVKMSKRRCLFAPVTHKISFPYVVIYVYIYISHLIVTKTNIGRMQKLNIVCLPFYLLCIDCYLSSKSVFCFSSVLIEWSILS